jgi:mannose-6-phosphate isomerase
MYRMQNVVQPYAWGSRTALAALRGEAVPSPGPEAELWMGAHPLAPSRVQVEGRLAPLDQLVASQPERWLGAQVAARFEGRLPFLLKVLAAAEPLSLQAHPSLPQAEAGFAREEGLGLPPGAPNRNYKDANHKPEILCALGPFEALYGFRDVQATRSLLGALGVPGLEGLLATLERSPAPAALRSAFAWLFGLEAGVREGLVGAVVAACARAPSGWEGEARWAVRMAALYPGDVGVIVALLMNLVRLAPGEALYLPAGNLHAYLEGTGVELMASSDNVLRGGLTRKHVDVPELMAVLDFSPIPARPLGPVRHGPEWVYPTDAQDFRLSRLELDAEISLPPGAPQIVLCTRGRAVLHQAGEAMALDPGASAFIPASTQPLRVSGPGEAFRATVG